MLAKTAEQGGRDWDQHLSYVLFAYCTSEQRSTSESPFFLLYGCDPQLPTDVALSPLKNHTQVDLKEYGIELVEKMSSAWSLARYYIKKLQKSYNDMKS